MTQRAVNRRKARLKKNLDQKALSIVSQWPRPPKYSVVEPDVAPRRTINLRPPPKFRR